MPTKSELQKQVADLKIENAELKAAQRAWRTEWNKLESNAEVLSQAAKNLLHQQNTWDQWLIMLREAAQPWWTEDDRDIYSPPES